MLLNGKIWISKGPMLSLNSSKRIFSRLAISESDLFWWHLPLHCFTRQSAGIPQDFWENPETSALVLHWWDIFLFQNSSIPSSKRETSTNSNDQVLNDLEIIYILCIDFIFWYFLMRCFWKSLVFILYLYFFWGFKCSNQCVMLKIQWKIKKGSFDCQPQNHLFYCSV